MHSKVRGGYGESYWEEEVQRLRGENAHLRQYSSRVEDELGRLARKYNHYEKLNIAEDDDQGDDGDEGEGSVAPWVSSPHLFSPLLMAYDARIAELRSTLGASERQMSEDREHVARLMGENERLEQELSAALAKNVSDLENRSSSSNSMRSGGKIDGNVGAVANETLTMLNSLVDTLQKENSILVERDSILNNDVERLTEQSKERDSQLLQITSNFQTAANGLRVAREQLEALKGERDAALSKLGSANTELSKVSVELEQTSTRLEEGDRDVTELRVQVSRLRGDLEELASRASAESELQEQRVALALKRTRAVQLELETATHERDATKAALQTLTLKHESLRLDGENLGAVVATQNSELFELRRREEATKQLEVDSRQRVEQANLERNQAMAVSTQRKEEVARLQEERIREARDAAKERQAAVQQAIVRAQTQIHALGVELEESETRRVRADSEASAAKADALEAASRLADLRKSAAEEIKRLETSLAKISERAERAEALASEREAEASRTLQNCAARVAEAEQERATSLDTAQSLRQQLQSNGLALEASKTESKRLLAEAEAADKDAARMRQELANFRLAGDAKLEATEQRAALAQQKLAQRITTAESRAQEMEQDLDNARAALARVSSHHKDELSAHISHFERLVNEQKEENARLRARSEDLSAQLHVMQAERAELVTNVKQSEARLQKAEAVYLSSEKRAADQKQQLAELLATEEKRVGELTELRKTLDQTQVKINRAVRERDAALAALDDTNYASERMARQHTSKTWSKNPPSPSSRQTRLRLETSRTAS